MSILNEQEEDLDYKHNDSNEDDDLFGSEDQGELGLVQYEENAQDGEQVNSQSSVRRSSRPISLSRTAMQQMVDNDVEEFGYSGACVAVTHGIPDPVTQKQAYESPYKEDWVHAEIDEMVSLYQHEVGKLVRRTPEMNVMGCRFIYKTKRHPKTREVKKRKARLVCQGFKQIKGVDYDKAFASQARFSSIRLLLFLVNIYDLDMFSFDIKTFFLYGELDEDVYMEQPPGYQTKGNDWVWHLLKSLYGCKQSPRQAGKKLRQVLLDWLFKLNKSDPNFYFVMLKMMLYFC